MIKTENFGRHLQTKIVEFGTGDVLMTRTTFESEGTIGLLIGNHEQRKVGEITTEYNGKSSDDLPNVEVVLAFKNPQSVGALIHSLMEVQKELFDKM